MRVPRLLILKQMMKEEIKLYATECVAKTYQLNEFIITNRFSNLSQGSSPKNSSLIAYQWAINFFFVHFTIVHCLPLLLSLGWQTIGWLFDKFSNFIEFAPSFKWNFWTSSVQTWMKNTCYQKRSCLCDDLIPLKFCSKFLGLEARLIWHVSLE